VTGSKRMRRSCRRAAAHVTTWQIRVIEMQMGWGMLVMLVFPTWWTHTGEVAESWSVGTRRVVCMIQSPPPPSMFDLQGLRKATITTSQLSACGPTFDPGISGMPEDLYRCAQLLCSCVANVSSEPSRVPIPVPAPHPDLSLSNLSPQSPGSDWL
jgi:hypothetical protein